MRAAHVLRRVLFLALTASLGTSFGQARRELNTLLMEATFRITGPAKADPQKKITFSTVFFMGKPKRPPSKEAFYVMVTAGHVLDDIAGDVAMLDLRTKEPDGSFKKLPFQIHIRDRGKDLYIKHKEADVAVMYAALPLQVRFTLLVPDFLAGDTEFEKYELHPGDELLCLGFPLGVQANEAGFPILRSGKIASYPLTPLKVVKHFLFDFKIYPGNSGGPVYFSYSGRTYGDTGRLGENLQYVVGLVTSSIGSLFFQGQEISVAQVVPAGFIVETINQLPELEK